MTIKARSALAELAQGVPGILLMLGAGMAAFLVVFSLSFRSTGCLEQCNLQLFQTVFNLAPWLFILAFLAAVCLFVFVAIFKRNRAWRVLAWGVGIQAALGLALSLLVIAATPVLD